VVRRVYNCATRNTANQRKEAGPILAGLGRFCQQLVRRLGSIPPLALPPLSRGRIGPSLPLKPRTIPLFS